MNSPETGYVDFQSLYLEYQPKILRYVSNLAGEAEAEDLAQEIMVKVSQALPSFRGEAKISTWIYRIATHAAIDRARHMAHQEPVAPVSTDALEATVDDRNIWTGEKVPIAEWQTVRKEMSACLQEYIQRLPEHYRTVLVLREFESLSSQEIAEILGISVGTVKIRLHRAIERLKKDLLANCPTYWVEGNEFLPDFGRIE